MEVWPLAQAGQGQGLTSVAFGVEHAAHSLFGASAAVALSPAQQLPPTPILRKTISSGQKLVKDDCSRLNPTNAVNQSQLGL